MDATKLIEAAKLAAQAIAASVAAVESVKASFETVRKDLSVNDAAEIEARLADAHALTLRVSKALDAKLAAVEKR